LKSPFAESVLEDAVLEWLGSIGYSAARGPTLAPGELLAERDDFREVLLVGRLRAALRRLNPDLPDAALIEAERQIMRPTSPALIIEIGASIAS